MNELFTGPSVTIWDLGFYDLHENRVDIGRLEAPYEKWNNESIEITDWKEIAKLVEDISDGKIPVENDDIYSVEFSTRLSDQNGKQILGTERWYRIDWIEGMRRLMEIIA